MSEENVAIVRRTFAALTRAGDAYWRNPGSLSEAMTAGELPAEINEVLEFVDPQAEWHPPPQDPDPTPRIGREAIVAYLEQWLEAWQDWRIEADDFVDAGDKVVARTKSTGTGRASGVEFPAYESAHVITVKDGRVVRVQGFYDRREALEAAGVAK